MVFRTDIASITYLQWLKLHLRLVALEENGARLSCRFEFPIECSDQIVCRIYFTDDEANSMRSTDAGERSEIHEGWIAFATHVIERGCELAELAPSLRWKTEVKFILLEDAGMGSRIVQTVIKPFVWPKDEGR